MKSLLYVLTLISSLFSFTQEETFKITNLKLNNEYPHFGLMYIGNNEVLFTSYKLNKRGKARLNDSPPLTIYRGSLSSNGEINNVTPVLIDSKANIEHVTSAAISPDGKQLYLTTFYNNKNRPKGNFKETNFHLEVGEYNEGVGWTNFKVLPFCQPKFSYGHPTLSKDGKTLYFIANVRGGKHQARGQSDIYRVEILGNNTYSELENLGANINSYSKEMFPFISSNNTLYYASNKPSGYGGFDIYKSKMKDDGTFEKATKMPKPINSRASDISFIIDESGRGYFSSKRKGGKGDDDIYYFTSN